MIIHTALYTEAKPIINLFGLKPNNSRFFKVFSNKDKVLIVSGIGKIDAALAISYIFSLYPKETFLISVGVAAAKDDFKIGQLVNIKKIIDLDEQKVYHLKSLPTLKNCTLGTSSTPQTKMVCELGDMEGSAVYKATKKYKKDLLLLKVVSDNFEPKKVKDSNIEKLILKNINQIKTTIYNYSIR